MRKIIDQQEAMDILHELVAAGDALLAAVRSGVIPPLEERERLVRDWDEMASEARALLEAAA